MNEQTICAVSTAPGVGGIAVIRISGPAAIEICDQLFQPKNQEKSIAIQKSYTLCYGKVVNQDQIIDDVLVSLFRNPHSFTGEDTVEITCHGSIYIQQQIMQVLVRKGCRCALPGEFTQRAFLNGKMDLSQAEAVADLIASTSAATHRLAMNQMRGGFSNELMLLRRELLDFTSLVELELDFSEEEVEFADRIQFKQIAANIEALISNLTNSFNLGNAIKKGIPVAIIGETNAGKSTLLNVLLREERAIVSEIHGTTRDVIEDTINIEGITFRFIDTAGIRDTQDKIESLGIKLAYRKMEQASIILWLIDATQNNHEIEHLALKILPSCQDKKVIMVFNKVDQLTPQEIESKKAILSNSDTERIFISAKKHYHTDQLQNMLLKAAEMPEIGDNDIIVTNVRHYEALINAQQAIHRVINGLDKGISGDFLSQDIRECMHYLGEITGHISNDDILGNIFANFCIGK